MARRPALSDVKLKPAPIEPVARKTAKRNPGRKGKRGVAFWLSPEAFRQLSIAAAEEDLTIQAIMEEATDLWFQSVGKHRIARQTGESSEAA